MSGPNIQNFGNISAATITNATWNGVAIAAAYGGSGFTTYTTGSILYASSSNALSQLVPSTNGYVLTLSGGLPVWAAATGGANTALSNLSAVAINTSLLPGSNNSISLGSSSFIWNTTWTQYISYPSGPSINLGASGGTTGYLVDSSGSPQIEWSTSGVSINSLTGYVYANGSGVATASTTIPGSAVSGNISGNAANVTGTVVVANGGTGDTSFTAYAPVAGGTTSTAALQSLSSGMSNSGYVLTSTGSSSAPTWQAASGGSAITALTGDVTATGPGSAAATVAKIQGTAVSGTTGTGNVVFSASPTFTGEALIADGTNQFNFILTSQSNVTVHTGDVYTDGTVNFTVTANGSSVTTIYVTGTARPSNIIELLTFVSGNGGSTASIYMINYVDALTPGLGFASEPGSGLYRLGTDDWGIALNGQTVLEFGTRTVAGMTGNVIGLGCAGAIATDPDSLFQAAGYFASTLKFNFSNFDTTSSTGTAIYVTGGNGANVVSLENYAYNTSNNPYMQGGGGLFANPNMDFLVVGAENDLYTFTLSAPASITVSTTYTNNGNTYTVTATTSSSTSLTVSGPGNPTSSGTLTFVSGSPSGNLTFTSFTAHGYIAYTVGGRVAANEVFRMTSTEITSALPILAGAGTSTFPGLGFSGYTEYGISMVSGTNMRILANEQPAIDIKAINGNAMTFGFNTTASSSAAIPILATTLYPGGNATYQFENSSSASTSSASLVVLTGSAPAATGIINYAYNGTAYYGGSSVLYADNESLGLIIASEYATGFIAFTTGGTYSSATERMRLTNSALSLNSGTILDMNGSSSGTVSITTQAAAGTYNFNLPTTAGTSGYVLTSAGGGSSPMTWAAASTGTVTSVSVTSANGFAGTVATATTTPAITISTTVNSPVLAGNGTAISAATTTGSGSTVVLADAPTFSGAVNMGAFQINDLGSPSISTDAATKGYVDAAVSGLTWKGPVQAYSNTNVALTGGSTLTIDSYSVQNGDYVILSNQTPASGNYVYVASGIGSAYVLTLVIGSEAPTAIGDAYLVEKGTVYGNTAFQVNATSPNVTFIQFAGPNTYTFTTPLSLTGNVVSIGYDNSTIGVTGGDLYVLNNGIGTAQLASSSVTYAKIQNVTASMLLGNPTGSAASPSEVSLGSTLTFSGSILETDAFTGDVTTSANSFATTVAKIQGTTVSGTTGTTNVVFSASPTLTGTITAAAANFSGAIGANDGITSTGALTIDANAGAAAVQIEALNVQRSTNGTNFITETYVDSTSLTDNSGPNAVTAFQFALASFAGEEITYIIESGDANADTRIGTIRVTANRSGTITPSLTDTYTESADCGVSWTATAMSGTISVLYSTTNQGAARTMRADCKFFRV